MPFVLDMMENKFFRDAYKKGLLEGEEKGKEKGEARGERKGRAESLLAQLKGRFDRVPVWAQKRIDGATVKQLERWALKILDAETLEDVVGKR